MQKNAEVDVSEFPKSQKFYSPPTMVEVVIRKLINLIHMPFLLHYGPYSLKVGSVFLKAYNVFNVLCINTKTPQYVLPLVMQIKSFFYNMNANTYQVILFKFFESLSQST